MPRGGVKKKREKQNVPRGGVRKKNRSETDWAVCRGLLLCAKRWRKGNMEKSVEDQ